MPSITEARTELARVRGAHPSDLKPGQTPSIPPFYDPLHIVDLGLQVLDSRLEHTERLQIIEQVVIAAIECGKLELAKTQLQVLESQMPKEYSRLKRLQGLLLEATGNVKKAQAIYEEILADNPGNVMIAKRLAMSFLTENNRPEAIAHLVTYLDTFMQDADAWTTLAQLYLEERMFQQAKYCYEELMLLKPKHHLYQLRYADVVASMGRFELAVKYYCAAVESVSESVHGWYGIRSTTRALIQEKNREQRHKASGVLQEECTNLETYRALNKLSQERLEALYSKAPAHLKSLLN
ncbi:hypothetical protein EDD86DRAFT_111716 [Gorgonomyces haynaldii]|nr:hypothetical protein EDD86DRAFT_111716 [Gorgonomyces haynaldii]